jgi:ATP-binding cassette subfamily C protein
MDAGDRRLVFIVPLLLLVNATLEAVGIGLVFPLIKIISAPDAVGDFRLIADALSLLAMADNENFLFIVALFILAIFTFKNVFLFASNIWQMWYLRRAESRVSKRLLLRYLRGRYSLFFERHSAEFIRNMLECVPSIYTGLLMNGVRVVTECLVAAAIAVTLFVVDPKTATVVSASLGGSALLAYWVLRRRIEYWGRQQMERSKERLQAAKEILGIAKEVKALGREEFFSRFFLTRQINFARTMVHTGALAEFPRLALEVAMVWVIIGAILWHSVGGNGNVDIVASLAVFAAAAFRLLPSANRLLAAFHNIRQNLPAVETVVRDFEDPSLDPVAPGDDGVKRTLTFKELALQNLEYRYPGTDANILNGLSLIIPRGESVAIVGPSGAGKTTLIDLILGLLSPTAGSVKLNGRDLGEQLRVWQNSVGYVPQSIFLLDDTLRRNIALGIDDEDIDSAALAQAVSVAHIDDFVRSLPCDLDTTIGEFGIRLSGGQRQRIGIARAMYRDPEVLILDEATSSLDNETEQHIANSIENLRGRKTLVIIAHRLSTVRHCDRIVFLKAGRIDDIGTFDQLYQRNSNFRKLATLGDLGLSPRPAEQSIEAPLEIP